MDDKRQQEMDSMVEEAREALRRALMGVHVAPATAVRPWEVRWQEHGGGLLGLPAGGTGKRTFDTFRWWHTGEGAVSVANVVVAYQGLAATYADGNVSVTSGSKYICATVVWTVDEDTGKVTGITSVTIEAKDSFAEASMEEEDGSGIRIPLYKLKKLATSGVDEVVCEIDYIHGTAQALAVNTDDWNVDADETEYAYTSIDRIDNPSGSAYPDIVTLYDFESPTAFTMRYNGHTDWSADKDKQKVLVRYEKSDETVVLRYATYYPMPLGDGTNCAGMWDETGGGWKAVPPKDTKDSSSSTALAAGDRVAVDIAKGSNGLLKAVTQPLGAFLTASDFTSIDVLVPTSTALWDASGKKIQFYKRSIKVPTASLGSEQTSQAVQFYDHDD